MSRDHSVHAPCQWETPLHRNVVSYWLEAYTKWSLHVPNISLSQLKKKSLFSFFQSAQLKKILPDPLALLAISLVPGHWATSYIKPCGGYHGPFFEGRTSTDAVFFPSLWCHKDVPVTKRVKHYLVISIFSGYGEQNTKCTEWNLHQQDQTQHQLYVSIFFLFQDMENKIRNVLNEIYFGKTKDIVNGLRSTTAVTDLKQRENLKNDLAQALRNRSQQGQ